jgi:hypothetical protein
MSPVDIDQTISEKDGEETPLNLNSEGADNFYDVAKNVFTPVVVNDQLSES